MWSNSNEPFQSGVGLVVWKHLTLEKRGRWALTPQLSAVKDDSSVRVALESCWQMSLNLLLGYPDPHWAEYCVLIVALWCDVPADCCLVDSVPVSKVSLLWAKGQVVQEHEELIDGLQGMGSSNSLSYGASLSLPNTHHRWQRWFNQRPETHEQIIWSKPKETEEIFNIKLFSLINLDQAGASESKNTWVQYGLIV